ncbi:DMT family transporter [Streptomyces sp. NPDC048219]|uniref:DMT family transporter n=1 Tax=Streptomyces sp. NPDC048219 TaxID=3365517 RepID=UPI00371CA7F5
MAWMVLVLAGIMETVWATALDASRNLSRLWPAVLFLVALVLSMTGLSYAMRTVPIGTSYAVWVGIGAVGTAAYGMVHDHDPATLARLLCLGLIVTGVVGLKFLH